MEQFPLPVGDALIRRVEEGVKMCIPPDRFFKSETEVAEERTTGKLRPTEGAPDDSSGYYESRAAEEVRSKVHALDHLRPHYVDSDGNITLALQMFVIETPGGVRIAVDTCIGDEKNLGDTHVFHQKQGPFLENLRTAGCAPESIDFVLCTHLHFDHVGFNTVLQEGRWVPTFPNARYLFAEKEWLSHQAEVEAVGDNSFVPLATVFRESLQPIVDAGLHKLVSSDHVVVEEPSCRVRLVPTEGHTVGHVSVVIESRGKSATITGDCIHHPAQLAYPQLGTFYDANSPEAADAREILFRSAAAQRTVIIGTHFPTPCACYVEREAAGTGRVYWPRPVQCHAGKEGAMPLKKWHRGGC